jgi:hypothetical protein
MKGFGKQLLAGFMVALFITTATYFVIHTAGFAYDDQMAVVEATVNGSDAPLTPVPSPPPPTPTPTPAPTPVPSVRVGNAFYWDLQTA